MTLPAELRAEYESGERWLSVLEVGTPEYNRQKYMNALLHRAADALEVMRESYRVLHFSSNIRQGAKCTEANVLAEMALQQIDAQIVMRELAAKTPLPATPEG